MQEELQALAVSMQELVGKTMAEMRSRLETTIGGYVNALVRRYHKELEARKRLHNRLVELNGPSINNS